MVELHELKKELNTQDNRATAYPLFCVCDYEKIYSSDSEFENYEYFSKDDGCCLGNDKEALLNYAKEIELIIPDPLMSEEEIYDFIRETSPIRKWYFVKRRQIKNVFLTCTGADEHVQSNLYNYDEPHIYVISAWRNPEMQKVQQFFKTMDFPDETDFLKLEISVIENPDPDTPGVTAGKHQSVQSGVEISRTLKQNCTENDGEM